MEIKKVKAGFWKNGVSPGRSRRRIRGNLTSGVKNGTESLEDQQVQQST